MSRTELEHLHVPAGWSARTVGDLCEIWSGGTPRKSEARYWTGDIPWVSGKDLKSLELSDSIDHVTREAVADGSRMAPARSVLLLVRGMGLAKDLPVAAITRPMAFNQDVKALVPRQDLSGSFLCFAICHAKRQLLSRIVPSAHGTMTLNLDDVESFSLNIPDSSGEADGIVTVLQRSQRAIENEVAAIRAATDLKSAAMRELFTRGLRREAQKETEIGLVPESWIVAPLGKVRHWLQYGTSKRCSSSPAAYPVLRIPNVGSGSVDATDLKYCDASRSDAEKYRLEVGDLLFIRTNGVLDRLGSCAVYAGEPARALFASYLIRARLKRDAIEPRFLAYFLGSARGSSLVAGRATPAADGKYNLNTGTIDSIPIPIPPSLAEQQEIATILDTIDRKIDLHKRKRAVLESLFKSLLHKLMTGEIRVADLNLSALESSATAGASA